jgi:hypothetical protein
LNVTKKATLDPSSERVVLSYTGDDSGHPYISGVQARDLSEAEVCRLASIRDTDTGTVLDELVGSGIYTLTVEGDPNG